MSTPSTATATLPPHHSHYGYSHHQSYQSNTGPYPPTNTVGPSRLTNSYNTVPGHNPTTSLSRSRNSPQSSKQPSQPATMASSKSASGLSGHQSRKRKPDWGDFYKNGVPKEIIVIDDDSPPPSTKHTENRRPTQNSRAANGTGTTQHVNKKRRTGVEAAYDPTYYDRPSYSTHSQHYGDESTGTPASTDRTTSLQTTAPTSLGSHGSSGASNGVYYEEAKVGEKRKRVTRKTARDDAKRKELENGDAFQDYVPPPKPPIKAGEVHVPVIRDVSIFRSQATSKLMFSVYVSKASKMR